MAQKYLIELIDDLDGSEASDSIQFGLDGVNYVIDLSDDNINALRSALGPYVSAARKGESGPKAGKTSKAAKPKSDLDLSAVREWANSNGFTVSSRGRVPATVLEAYTAAH